MDGPSVLWTVLLVGIVVLVALLTPRLGGVPQGLERYESDHAPDDAATAEFEANVERSRTIPPP